MQAQIIPILVQKIKTFQEEQQVQAGYAIEELISLKVGPFQIHHATTAPSPCPRLRCDEPLGVDL